MTEEINKPIYLKMNLKFIREIGGQGIRLKSGDSNGYMLPFMYVRNTSMPVGIYQAIKLSDLPDHVLAGIGLQKIPANDEKD